MDLLVVRHAKATDKGGMSDAYRPLTGRGRADALAVGKALRHAGAKVDVIVTSPLVRAVQTAELAAVGLRYEAAIEVAPELVPDGAPELVIEDVILPRAEHGLVALVGHEPQLGHLIGMLLRAGAPSPRKSSAVYLSWPVPAAAARFEWVIHPDRERPSRAIADIG